MKKEKQQIDWNSLLPKPLVDYKFEEDHIILFVPRTRNRFMKKVLQYLNKENIRFMHLDQLGTYVWKCMETKKTIGEIIADVSQHFPEETQLDQRTLLFFQQLYREGYIELYAPDHS